MYITPSLFIFIFFLPYFYNFALLPLNVSFILSKTDFFFKAAIASKLLYGCTRQTLTKRIAKKLDVGCKRMLRAILNES